MKLKLVKFILISLFLFTLAYTNKADIPYPIELKTMDFILSNGIDINLNAADSQEKCSISYITGEDTSNGGNSDKKLFNIKSDTLFRTIEKLQGITNKSLSSSHLQYILIGEQTAKENLEYFTKHYSKMPKIRLDVNIFAIKDLTSEEFLKKALTSDIDVNDRLDGIVNNREQLSYLTKKNLKDLLQITYSKTQTGVIPVLHIIESPEQKAEDISQENKENKSYTFGCYGLGIIKNGNLTDYLPYELVRSYLMLTQNLKNTTIEINIEAEIETEKFFVFQVENTANNISFEFDKDNNLVKVKFNVNVNTSYAESDALEIKNTANNNHLESLNTLQADVLRDEIEEIIAISKELDTDFLGIGETLSIQHQYKWHSIEKNWADIFKDLDYETNVSVKTQRYYNIN